MSGERLLAAAEQARNRGEIDEAIVEYGQKRVEAMVDQDFRLAAECQHMIGVSYYQARQWGLATENLTQSLEEMRSQRDEVGEGAVLRDLGLVEAARGNFPPAERYLKASIKVLQQTPNRGHWGMSMVKWGVVMARIGHEGQAIAQIRAGIEKIKQSPERAFLALAQEDLGRVLLQQGQTSEAKVELEKAVEAFWVLDNSEQFAARVEAIEKLLV